MEALTYWNPSFKVTKKDKLPFLARDDLVSSLLLVPTAVVVVGEADDLISSISDNHSDLEREMVYFLMKET